jgi:hypothetical protein
MDTVWKRLALLFALAVDDNDTIRHEWLCCHWCHKGWLLAVLSWFS